MDRNVERIAVHSYPLRKRTFGVMEYLIHYV